LNDRRERPGFRKGLGAEGATAPETLRQKDRTVDDALERSRQSLAGSPKE
jgi:hypothetical protein